ncbi:aminotransferase class I/II-fold pyridoxal phosphate-dependent enzyme [Sciscionella sediminilitoris]|uniref:aminotransferase class I/II-fold pyridoxal phosphate-dependent enzyme n=1 Tax=Sciscionella sediminilitoris TaxID=1445613 RepID=UPI0004DF8A85|nr:aminotransferase class I/II-fold pyridoxal phosphate-dependent enzyme [Sciscionella sp. SE31]
MTDTATGLHRRLPDFRLETHFAQWEFAAEYHLTASDVETMTMAELLELGTEDDRAALAELPLGYVETRGGESLRTAIAGTYSVCEPDDILAFAGAEEALYWSLQVLAGPGDHVLVTVPNYQALEQIPLASGAQVSGVLLNEHENWRLDLDAVRAALRPDTRLIAVNFPNNPTGAVPDLPTWRGLLELCQERGIRLLSDEAYRGLESDPEKTLPQAADLSPNAISVNVMSKSYGLPGLRVGWVACQDHAVLDALERHKHYTSICNSGPSELLAGIALRAGEQIHARNRGIIAENRPHFDAFFEQHTDFFDWQPPDGGCVAFPRYHGPDGVEKFCAQLVHEAGVLLLPASLYHSALTTTPGDRFRIGIGRRNPAPALAALDRFLTN